MCWERLPGRSPNTTGQNRRPTAGRRWAATNSIEVEAPALFDRVARKWNVDYAFYQVAPDKHLLFFKAGQADAITACFSEYSKRLLKRTKSAKAPIREQIKEAAAEAARQPAQKLERTKEAVHEDR